MDWSLRTTMTFRPYVLSRARASFSERPFSVVRSARRMVSGAVECHCSSLTSRFLPDSNAVYQTPCTANLSQGANEFLMFFLTCNHAFRTQPASFDYDVHVL